MRRHAVIVTYTDGDGDGIYTCPVATDGLPETDRVNSNPVPDDPSFVARHPTGDCWYAVHETDLALRARFRSTRTANRAAESGRDRCRMPLLLPYSPVWGPPARGPLYRERRVGPPDRGRRDAREPNGGRRARGSATNSTRRGRCSNRLNRLEYSSISIEYRPVHRT